MKVSPSIASADVLNVESEVRYIDKYFDNIHIDIEDGVAVGGISFGMKMAKGICQISTSKEKTMHLEVLNPLIYIDDVKECGCDVTFIQVSHLSSPMEIIDKYKNAGIDIGINLCDEDLSRNDLQYLLSASNNILIGTTSHWDPNQEYLMKMEEFALQLAEDDKRRVWIDGCVTYETFLRLNKTKLYCTVIGRGIFKDKDLAIKQYCFSK